MRIESKKLRLGLRVGVLELLGLLFVGLKLGGVVDWPWWAVTLPFWGVPALALAGVAISSLGLFLTKLGHSLKARANASSPVGDAEWAAIRRVAELGKEGP